VRYIIDAFDNRPLIPLQDRKYLVNPLTDQEPAATYELINDVVEELSTLSDFTHATKIVGEEDRGGFIAALMAYVHKLPFGMVKWSPNGLEGQLAADFRNAYVGGKMFLNGVVKGDKVIIVEDMIDSGGTIIAMIGLLRYAGVEILDIIAIAEKEEYEGIARIQQETGYAVKKLIRFSSSGETSKVTWVRS